MSGTVLSSHDFCRLPTLCESKDIWMMNPIFPHPFWVPILVCELKGNGEEHTETCRQLIPFLLPTLTRPMYPGPLLSFRTLRRSPQHSPKSGPGSSQVKNRLRCCSSRSSHAFDQKMSSIDCLLDASSRAPHRRLPPIHFLSSGELILNSLLVIASILCHRIDCWTVSVSPSWGSGLPIW